MGYLCVKKWRFIPGIIALFLLAGCGVTHKGQRGVEPAFKVQKRGQIYIYGEAHSDKDCLDRELQLWESFYKQGLRHLFIEGAFFESEWFNLWMKAEDDAIFVQHYEDIQRTRGYSLAAYKFYKKIKEKCPETIFHGFDVGHQYDTGGARYLAYLADRGQADSEAYRRTQENIEQAKIYYKDRKNPDSFYREEKMAQNFIRDFEALNGESIMAITGAMHVDAEGIDSYLDYNQDPRFCYSLLRRLKERYGDAVHAESLTIPQGFTKKEVVYHNGMDFEAFYFGTYPLPPYKVVEFWQLSRALAGFDDYPETEEQVNGAQYPMKLYECEIYLLKCPKADGSIENQYYRSTYDAAKNRVITRRLKVE